MRAIRKLPWRSDSPAGGSAGCAKKWITWCGSALIACTLAVNHGEGYVAAGRAATAVPAAVVADGGVLSPSPVLNQPTVRALADTLDDDLSEDERLAILSPLCTLDDVVVPVASP